MSLLAVGGAIDVETPGRVWSTFYEQAGGAEACLVIIPTASENPAETCAHYTAAWQKLGHTNPITCLNITTRAQTLTPDPAHIMALRSATGIFLTGGNQLRLTTVWGGTPLADELKLAEQRGALVMGSSAGTAALSTVMMAYGEAGYLPMQGMVQLTAGLGLTNTLLFDQHFAERQRFGRLLYAIATNPHYLGVGVDENSAAWVRGSELEVVGAGTVTILDGSAITSSNVAELEAGGRVAVSGVKFHLLTAGCLFRLDTRQVLIPQQFLTLSEN